MLGWKGGGGGGGRGEEDVEAQNKCSYQFHYMT